MTMKIVHTEEMAEIRCGNPECSRILVIVPQCHPSKVVEARYHKDDGTLRITCAECGRDVIGFQIASVPKGKLQ